jgi:hypothetical protein
MVKYGQIWSNMVKHGQTWSILNVLTIFGEGGSLAVVHKADRLRSENYPFPLSIPVLACLAHYK